MSYETREFLGWCLFGAGIVAVIITITISIATFAINSSHRDGQIMQQCIAAGGSWVQGSCILGRSK